MKYTLGILGAGVMGQAILSRIVASNIISENKIAVFDIDSQKVNSLPYNIANIASAQELIDESEFILFAVKPQHYAAICEKVTFTEKNTILSIMAGVKISTLKSKINTNCGIVRIMPNTPCKIGKGVSAICFDNIEPSNKNFVLKIFSACGKVVEVEEHTFDAVTSVSGSGPAYVFMFANAMIKGGMEGGLSYQDSKELALHTIIGTASLALQSDQSLEFLLDSVCSKGGTTIEAIKVFRQNKLEETIIEGMNACREKSKSMSETL